MSEAGAARTSLDIGGWLAMFVRPRATVRRVLDEDPGRDVRLLAALAGIASAFNSAAAWVLGDRFATSDIVIVSIPAGALGGVLGLYVWGWLIALVGRWLGGAAGAREARTAVAWGNAPWVFTLPVYAAAIWQFGHEFFESDQPRMEALPLVGLAYGAVALVITVVAIWTFVVFVATVAETQRFSVWKGLANVLLALAPVVLATLAFMSLVLFRDGSGAVIRLF